MQNADQLTHKVIEWLTDENLRKQIGAHGLAVIEQIISCNCEDDEASG